MATDRIYGAMYKGLKEKINNEYKIIETPNANDINEKTLLEFDQNGWELLNVVQFLDNEILKYKMIFKKSGNPFIEE